MTKIEIIEETANFYNTKNRSIRESGISGSGRCQYENFQGFNCAVGRCLTKESIKMILEKEMNGNSVAQLDGEFGLDDLLEDRYKGHEMMFWRGLQQFHDADENFNNDGLTQIGTEAKNKLINRYKH